MYITVTLNLHFTFVHKRPSKIHSSIKLTKADTFQEICQVEFGVSEAG
jgi:hypothetical protein